MVSIEPLWRLIFLDTNILLDPQHLYFESDHEDFHC